MSTLPVRVTRILEYTYVDAEEAWADMDRWAVPANGATNFNRRTQIRSAVIGPVFGESWELEIDARQDPGEIDRLLGELRPEDPEK